MRRFALLLAVVAGCSKNIRSITTDAVLGRVVIYRNGVAFYERTARVVDGRVTVRVPRERVDDFLKSLTVVDPTTRKPMSVSIPRKESEDGSFLTMSLETQGGGPAEVLLTYVTESPAWKPSYRVVVGKDQKVMLEGWAIVDNMSNEDWKGVLVGVGASSALSFRYDLWSVVHVDRDLLQGEAGFAIAPPTGMSPYAQGEGEEIAALEGDEIRSDAKISGGTTSQQNTYTVDGIDTSGLIRGAGVQGVVSDTSGNALAGVTVIVSSSTMKNPQAVITDEKGHYRVEALPPGNYLVTFYYADKTIERSNVVVKKDKATAVYQKINVQDVGGETIAIRDTAPTIEPTSTSHGVLIDKNEIKNMPLPGRTFENTLGAAAGAQSEPYGVSFSGSSSLENSYERPAPPPPVRLGDEKLANAAKQIIKEKKDVIVQANGLTQEDALKKATAVKNKLVDDGIPATRIHVRTEVGGDNRVRVLAVAPSSASGNTGAPPTAAGSRANMPETPVGESHFMAERPMNVRAGSSAMVSMVQSETKGGIVYLYDPISDRGDERFAFKAVRLDNPTDDTLEPGPVTVYGDGRFIGEGITEPVPPKAAVVVPFALDRQIMVSSNANEADRVAKILTVERGIVTAEVQHRRTLTFTVTSRLHQPTRVYLRHRLQSGWTLVESPKNHMTVGDSKLFEVELGPKETRYVTIAEATPVERRLDLSAEHPLEMMKLFVDEPEASPKLRAQISALLDTHRAAAGFVDQITTLREQLVEYRQRSGELHAQIVTLKAVRTGGELMQQLKARLGEMNERMQKATLDIVATQEKLMLARVKFQNQLGDLRLTDVTESVSKR